MMFALEAPGENEDVVVHLIKRGAEVNIGSLEGWTPLLKATQKEYHSTMKILLENGANPKCKLNSTHYTPLHLACEQGDLEAVKILVRNGGADLDAQSKEKLTPLELTKKILDEFQPGNPRIAAYQEIYKFLQGVWSELEKKAQKAKDELVK
jgi:ankyrin repeat protein